LIDLNALNEEILGGLKNEESRLDDAAEAADFFRGRFDAYGSRPPTSAWEGARYKRESRIMTWLVETLAMNLYAAGPARQMPDHPAASEWLNGIYKTSAIDALLQSADEWATVGQVCAVQVIATDDPARPIRHALWPAHQFCIWESEEDPLCPEAVVTIDRYDNRRRVRLWTSDARRTYTSEKLMPGQTTGGRELTLRQAIPNPFGILPFAFVHYKLATTEFWSSSPGQAFVLLNDYTNGSLTESGDGIRYCGKPIIVGTGVRPGWRPSTPVQPGDMWFPPSDAGDVDGGGGAGQAELGYLLPDMGFVEAHWSDLQGYLDHSMECAGVPTNLFRLTAGAPSGLAIIAEQLPLILRAEGRQRPFSHYELALARVTLAVGAAHLGAQSPGSGLAVAAEQLRQAAADPGLTLRWPCMRPKLTGAEAIASDQASLDDHTKSRTMIVMERESMTREEAEDYLDQVAEDLIREQKLFAALTLDPLKPIDPDAQVDDPNRTPPAGADDKKLDPDDEDSDEDG
jgi:hypothetical protein